MTAASTIASTISSYCVFFVIVGIILYGVKRGVGVFDAFLEGAGTALDVILKIVPYLIAIIVAYGMLKDSLAIDTIATILSPLLKQLSIPKELVPLGLMRPFSGAASNGIMNDLINEYGPDSLVALTSATIMGSTETSLYIAAVYFGAVGVKRTRHAVPASLVGELAGFIAAVYICQYMLG